MSQTISSDTNTIGTLTTFPQLLSQEHIVTIPKVQRDYAYGRNEDKAIAILADLLHTILRAVRDDSIEILDFVYGGPLVKSDTAAGASSQGFVPLDGQQRLTTLFLLYYYASLRPGVSDEDIAFLHHFRYETRTTATTFCHALLTDIRQYILAMRYPTEGEPSKRGVCELITNHRSYLPTYSLDPTIAAMLLALTTIETFCNKEEYHVDDLWHRLINNNNIQFYSLHLSDFGLTDDLYIKMNSRGKRLTPFEIFRSQLEQHVAAIAPERKQELSLKLDTTWMDVIWAYAQASGKEIIVKADSAYMNLFRNIFLMELCRREIIAKKTVPLSSYLPEVLRDADDVERLIQTLDIIATIHTTVGINDEWTTFFYYDDIYTCPVGKADKIRLFQQQRQHQKSIFYIAMDEELSLYLLTFFYAMLQLHREECQSYSHDTMFRCLRELRNLTADNDIRPFIRERVISSLLRNIDVIIDNQGVVPEIDDTIAFTAPRWNEEHKKTTTLISIYPQLLEYENHVALRGSLTLFINKYYPQDSPADNATTLLAQLQHFAQLFNNNTYKKNYFGGTDYFIDLRCALIAQGARQQQEHMQCEVGPDKSDITWRLLLHTPFRRNGDNKTPSALGDFFVSLETRRYQEAILDIIANIDASAVPHYGQSAQQFDIFSWQYYYCKYPYYSIAFDTHGYYLWEDKEHKPLLAIILMRSQRRENGREWLMMNKILADEFNDHYKKEHHDCTITCSLDGHREQPVVVNNTGITLSIYQDEQHAGWIVNDDNNLLAATDADDDRPYQLTPLANEEASVDGGAASAALDTHTYLLTANTTADTTANNAETTDLITAAVALIANIHIGLNP